MTDENPVLGPLSPIQQLNGLSCSPTVDESKLLICRELYNGGFSELIGARDLANGSAVAIKRIDFSRKIYSKLPMRIIKARMIRKLTDRIDGLRQMNQLNVMKTIDFTVKDDKIIIVMEMCMFGDFFNWVLQQGSFTEYDAIVALQHILKGIRYLHEKGYAHGDLKPNNIVFQTVGPYSVVVMPEISLMKEISKVIRKDLIILDCYAPELLSLNVEDEVSITKEMDIWSLGIIGYIMISGRAPFLGSNRIEVRRKIIENIDNIFDSPPWRLIHQQTKSILTSLLHIEPENRGAIDRPINDRLKDDQSQHKCINLINLTEYEMLATCRRYRLNSIQCMEDLKHSTDEYIDE